MPRHPALPTPGSLCRHAWTMHIVSCTEGTSPRLLIKPCGPLMAAEWLPHEGLKDALAYCSEFSVDVDLVQL